MFNKRIRSWLRTIYPYSLDAAVPHVIFTKNAARGIKTDKAASKGKPAKLGYRAVPLVGAALWAAQRVMASAGAGQVYAFPQYISKAGKLNNDSASATVNKWLKNKGLNHTSHDFRHTMRDRLRNTGCPSEVALEIGGWRSNTWVAVLKNRSISQLFLPTLSW